MVDKRSIIYYLVSIVALLLVVNIILSKLGKSKTSETVKEISIEKANDIFLKTLSTFDIKDEWIKKKKLTRGKYDSLKVKYSIEVPKAISIPLVLKDLNEQFNSFPVKLFSEEGKYGFSNLKIISNGKVKLNSEFRYLKGESINFNKIGFIIYDYIDGDEDDINKLFSLAYPFGVILPLEEESQKVAEIIKSKNYNYFVELSNDADYIKFELNEEKGIEFLANNVKNIISYFNSPKFFFINTSKNQFSKTTLKFLKEKFEERGRNLKFVNSYVKLKGENKTDLASLFNFHLNQLGNQGEKVFMIDLEDWFLLQDELNNFIKTGNKIVLPSKLM